MAIKYLSNVNIDGTLTLTVNADSDSTYTGIVVSESGLLKYRTKAQILSDIGAGTGSMSSFIVAADTNTAATTITNGETLSILGGSGINTVSNPDGTITISASGSGTMTSWDIGSTTGANQTVSNGEVVDIVGGTKISGTIGGTRTVTLDHDTQSQSDSTSSGSLGSGGTFQVPTVAVDTTGHVTGTDTKTITIAAFDNYTGWKLDAESSGSTLSVGSGSTVDFIGGTGISTSKAAGPDLTITNDLPFNNIGTAGDSGSSTITNQGTITVAGGTGISTVDDGAGTITITASGSGTMSSWTLKGDTGSQTVSDGDPVSFAGGTGISTVASNTDILTITNDLPFNSLTLAASTGGNSTISNSGTITIAAGSNISTTNDTNGTVTIAYTGNTGTMSSFDISDGTTSQTISNGNTITFTSPAGNAADAGILPVVSATDTVTMNLDLSRIQIATELDDPDTDFLVYYDENNDINQRIKVEDVHLNDFGSPTSDLSIGSQKLTNVATGTAGTDGVNLSQVQSIAAGIGVFQGGYNASSDPGTSTFL